MTNLPISSPSSLPPATVLADADTVPITEAGVSRVVALSVLKAFFNAQPAIVESLENARVTTVGPMLTTAAGATYGINASAQYLVNGVADTNSANVVLLLMHAHKVYQKSATGNYYTSGTTLALDSYTGNTDPTVVVVAPATGAAVTTAVRNTSATPAAVVVPDPLTRAFPTISAAVAGETANGTVLSSTTGSLTFADGAVLTLVADPNSAGQFSIRVNGNPVKGRVNLSTFYNNDGLNAVNRVLYWNHRAYFVLSYYAAHTPETWFLLQSAPYADCDTWSGDPRIDDGIADAVAPAGNPPYGLGGHPGSIGDANFFEPGVTGFTQQFGRLAYINGFTTFNAEWNTWSNDSYTASNALKASPGAKQAIPVVGIAMCRNYFGYYSAIPAGSASTITHASQIDFIDVINGLHDADITAVAKGWYSNFDEVHFRPGYEFNGTFMAWYAGGQGGDTVTPPLWVAAFKKFYTVLHAAAASYSPPKICNVCWNPASQNYTEIDVKSLYPGDSYCDSHGLDTYSPLYTQDATDWHNGTTYAGVSDNNQDIWRVLQAGDPINRMHFWDYPNAKQGSPTGTGSGWGMQDALAFALARGKPFCIPETGCGSVYNSNIGPTETPEFPYWLRSRLDQAVNMGIKVLYLNIWPNNESDGGWGTGRERPRDALAWASAFGGTGAAAAPVITPAKSIASPSGSILRTTNASLVDSNGVSWTLTPYSTGYYEAARNGVGDTRVDVNPINYLLYYNGGMYCHAQDNVQYLYDTPNDKYNAVADPRPAATVAAHIVVTDGTGASYSIDLPLPIVTTNYYTSSTGLAGNFYLYADADPADWIVGTFDANLTPTIVLTRNGNRVSADKFTNTSYL